MNSPLFFAAYALLFYAILGFSVTANNLFCFSAAVFAYIFIPIVELYTKGTTYNMTKEEEVKAKQNSFYSWILYLVLPLQYVLLYFFLKSIAVQDNSAWILFGKSLSMGLACGIYGTNVAHELGHRFTKYERGMAFALLLTTLHMHFYIEHNRGHHKHMASDKDPNTARYGESGYAFFKRAAWGEWINAWHLEKDRLIKEGKSPWSINNLFLVFNLIQIVFCVAIFLVFGGKALLGFFLASLFGIRLHKTVDYIEHYGLQRVEIAPDRYEKIKPEHSWNCNHTLGMLMLFNLPRHSDHHYSASRPYQTLRHYDHTPIMPTGYPGTMLLSLVPPLWFKIMHKRLEAFKKTNPITSEEKVLSE